MAALANNMRKLDIINVQKALNELLRNAPGFKPLDTDGAFGKKSIEALTEVQKANGLTPDGIWGPKTASVIDPVVKAKKFITYEDVATVAAEINVPDKALLAVLFVETKGFGFFPKSGRPAILFERHWFYRHLDQKLGKAQADAIFKDNPDICNPSAGGYIGGEPEWDRLSRAVAIDPWAAYMSASFGIGQVMGFNHKVAGYADVFKFVDAMMQDEITQLRAMASFIANQKHKNKDRLQMDEALRKQNWDDFAYVYNGAGYLKYDYANKLRGQYKLA